MKQVDLNIDELNNFVKHIVTNNRFLQAQGKMPVAINVIGEAGIGKTSALIEEGNALGLEVVKVNLAQLEELSDLVGFPVRQFELCKSSTALPMAVVTEAAPVKRMITVKRMVKKTVNQMVDVMEKQEVDDFIETTVKKQVLEGGKFVTKDIITKTPTKVMKEVPVEKMMDVEIEVEEDFTEEVTDPAAPINTPMEVNGCLWIDEPAVQEYLKQGYAFTGQKRMSYCAPEWIAGKTGGGILLLDDYTRADVRFTQACMDLIDRQQYISWKLPKDWHIVLSSNPAGGDYFVTELDPAQSSRFISVNLKFDADIWARWAERAGVDSRCINFLLMHPELITQTTNARSITTFFNSISSIEKFEESLPLIQMIGEGSVGPEFAIMFTSFINNKLDKMISPKEILLHDSEQYVMGALRSTIGRDENYRADIASVMASRIINYSLFYAEDNSITQKETDRLIRLTTDEDTFNNDLQYHMIKKILNGNKQKFQKMMTNQDVLKMAMK